MLEILRLTIYITKINMETHILLDTQNCEYIKQSVVRTNISFPNFPHSFFVHTHIHSAHMQF